MLVAWRRSDSTCSETVSNLRSDGNVSFAVKALKSNKDSGDYATKTKKRGRRSSQVIVPSSNPAPTVSPDKLHD